MGRLMMQRMALVCALVGAWAIAGPAQENPYKSAISVNGISISNFEVDQRERLLRAIQTRGNLREQAEDALISERLYLEEAERWGVTVSEDEIVDGINEFAGRTSLEPDAFLQEIAKFGVARESFEAFIRAGVAWRKLVNQRFGPRVGELGNEDLDHSLAFRPQPVSETVHLSEIALPVRPGATARSREIAGQIHRTVKSASEFEEVARSLSIANSRDKGGEIGWINPARLPAAVRSAVVDAPVGGVTRPVDTPNAVFVFFKHQVRKTGGGLVPATTDYAVFRVAGDNGQTARQRAYMLMARADDCDDLYSASRSYPRGTFIRRELPPNSEPNRYSIEMARLDQGEFAIFPLQGADVVELLMLCGRKIVLRDDQRQVALEQLRNEKLQDYARGLIANLRASATIKRH